MTYTKENDDTMTEIHTIAKSQLGQYFHWLQESDENVLVVEEYVFPTASRLKSSAHLAFSNELSCCQPVPVKKLKRKLKNKEREKEEKKSQLKCDLLGRG